MQMAIDVAGLHARPRPTSCARRWARSGRTERMERLRERFDEGLARNGITGAVADEICGEARRVRQLRLPRESHSVSFAYLVYSSSWLKLHYPAAFCAALLNAQPMGFYSPQSLVQDARRHGVEVRTPDLDASDWCASLEEGPVRDGEKRPEKRDTSVTSGQGHGTAHPSGHGAAGPVGWGNGRGDRTDPSTWGRGGPAVRLGFDSVRGIGEDLAKEIAAGRPYAGMEDLARRVTLTRAQLEALATAGVFTPSTSTSSRGSGLDDVDGPNPGRQGIRRRIDDRRSGRRVRRHR